MPVAQNEFGLAGSTAIDVTRPGEYG